MTKFDHNGCKVVKHKGDKVLTVYGHNGQGWVKIFKEHEIYSADDARLVIDHHQEFLLK